MPPPKKAPPELGPSCICTQARNADAHPGTAAKNALRVWNPPWDPEVTKKEKVDKEAKKAAKQKMLEETQANEEAATHFVEEYHTWKETEESEEDIPCQRPKGEHLNLLRRVIVLYCTQLVKTYLMSKTLLLNPLKSLLLWFHQLFDSPFSFPICFTHLFIVSLLFHIRSFHIDWCCTLMAVLVNIQHSFHQLHTA